ncbi:MAG: ATP-dependent protease ATPase subunit HslU [Candidatus Eremiobacteraeota bacterium]|nr:ATP-dependent protease ATPase subunit HslU [Candidatus Eremiobacteraeota bacterium]
MALLTPKKIVEELDKYIVGQKNAKKSVAIALRNRYRRSLLPEEMQEEIIPKNILMIGPTGVGKTEIARRLARLSNAPFIKVEATKYTEVGYVGRDVESMVRDLTEIGIRIIQVEKMKKVQEKAAERAVDFIVDALMPKQEKEVTNPFQMILGSLSPSNTQAERFEEFDDEEEDNLGDEDSENERESKKEELRKKVESGEMDDEYVEVEVEENPSVDTISVFSQAGLEEMGVDFQSILGNIFPKKKMSRKMKVTEARQLIQHEEAKRMIDRDEVKRIAVQKVEQHGIIFLDEMDKIAGREKGHGPDVSREGVQRDLLPIVEGTTVITKYGPVRTNHILFISAGAFNVSKPSDLIPELQGRFPIRVELTSLNRDDFVRILTEPKNALVKQYMALMGTEGVNLKFAKSGVEELASLCQTVNETTENIGARRLHTVMEKLLEEIAYDAPDIKVKKITIDKKYVNKKLKDIVEDQDLSQYIL